MNRAHRRSRRSRMDTAKPSLTMRLVRIPRYGGPDELQVKAGPQPRAGEVLVRVHAAGVNPLDWKVRRGELQVFQRVTIPFTHGIELAGVVAAAAVLVGATTAWRTCARDLCRLLTTGQNDLADGLDQGGGRRRCVARGVGHDAQRVRLTDRYDAQPGRNGSCEASSRLSGNPTGNRVGG